MKIPIFPWLTEAQEASHAYARGKPYKAFPGPGTVGYCAAAARALYSAVRREELPFARRDRDADGDVDAMDMLRLEREAGYACDWKTAKRMGFIKPGARLYFAERNGDHGHVVTVVDGTPEDGPIIVFENTSSRARGQGSHICNLSSVQAGRTPAAVGHYGI